MKRVLNVAEAHELLRDPLRLAVFLSTRFEQEFFYLLYYPFHDFNTESYGVDYIMKEAIGWNFDGQCKSDNERYVYWAMCLTLIREGDQLC